MKKILVTGGAGFVGSNICIKLKEAHPSIDLVAFDNLKRRGSEINLSRLAKVGVSFIHGDVRNKSDLFDVGHVDAIIEASAEPSVLSGLNSSPDYLIDTNLNGTINCLSFARKYNAKFIFLSTSRVYPIIKLEEIKVFESDTRFEISTNNNISGISQHGISENFPLEGPRSLYGSTKLASELLIQEYNHFLNVPCIVNRCGLITGPYQMGKVDQGVIVLWVAKHMYNKSLSYFGYGGTGKQVRDILHVDDLFRLVEHQLLNFDLYNGQVFNVGGGRECSLSLLELTKLCVHYTKKEIPIHHVLENRQADIKLYLSDNTKISSLSGWRPYWTPEMIIENIVDWISLNYETLQPILS